MIRHHVTDELAFPLLLRGLTSTQSWTKLDMAQLEEQTTKPIVENPEVIYQVDSK